MQPLHFMSDFEAALRDSFTEVYPQAEPNGCWYHFAQSIIARMKKSGLWTQLCSNMDVRRYVRFLICTALLPPEFVML
jgi:hypothetical protein